MSHQEIPLSNIERALSVTRRMIDARAALLTLLRGDYWRFIKGFVDQVKERRRNTGKSPVEIMCSMAEGELDQMLLLAMLAATLEIIEEDAKCAGAL